MKYIGFILALTAVAANAEDGVSASLAQPGDTVTSAMRVDEKRYLQPSTPAIMLEEQLDQVSRELDAELEQRLAERAAARISDDNLLVSTD